MSKLINISIDVTAIPKDKIVPHKNGKKYLSLDVWINDEPDDYGNDCSVNIRQSKEEREGKERKTYIGNGKKMLGFDEAQKPAERRAAPASRRPAADPDLDVQPDDIPF